MREASVLVERQRCDVPRYHFDVRGGFHRDEIGEEFVDVDEAIAQAQTILPDIAWKKCRMATGTRSPVM